MMNEPMYCPLAFNIRGIDGTAFMFPCNPKCALAVNNGESYGCAIAIEATVYGYIVNSRPLKEEDK